MGQNLQAFADVVGGLVNATRGAHRPSADKPVMVSMVVGEKEVDAWWQYLKAKGVDVGDAPGAGGDGAVKAFGFEDRKATHSKCSRGSARSRFADARVRLFGS